MSDFNFIIGDEFKKLQENLQSTIQFYPEIAQNELLNTTNSFVSAVMEKERESISSEICEKIEDGFVISGPTSDSENIEVNLSNSSPEFNSAENGYELKDQNGDTIGFIEGNHYAQAILKDYSDNVMPNVMKNILDKIIKDCDLE